MQAGFVGLAASSNGITSSQLPFVGGRTPANNIPPKWAVSYAPDAYSLQTWQVRILQTSAGPPDSMVINIATFSETSPPQTSSFGLEPSVLKSSGVGALFTASFGHFRFQPLFEIPSAQHFGRV